MRYLTPASALAAAFLVACGKSQPSASNDGAVRDFIVLHAASGPVSESTVAEFAEVLRSADGSGLIVAPAMTEQEYARLAEQSPAEAEQLLQNELVYSGLFRGLSSRLISTADESDDSVDALKRVIAYNREHDSLAVWTLTLNAVEKSIDKSHASSQR